MDTVSRMRPDDRTAQRLLSYDLHLCRAVLLRLREPVEDMPLSAVGTGRAPRTRRASRPARPPSAYRRRTSANATTEAHTPGRQA